jgi:L-ascorbate metabolism protein UlaG (beta-lactamase superfamily)
MKIFHLFSLLLLLSSCSILEDEIFKNTDNQAMLEEEDLINDKKAPPFSFFRALQSVEREEIEISNEYNSISEKPLGYTSWIGHSSFIINNYDLNIITDPIFSNRASPLSFLGPKRLIKPAIGYKDLPKVDVVVISHNHYDHLDLDSIKRLNSINPETIFLVPLKLKNWFLNKGIKNVFEFEWWQSKTIKNTTFTFVPVQHWSRRGLFDKNKSLWGGWWIENSKIKLVHLGDTGYSKDFIEINKRLGNPDIAFIPIGAYSPRRIMKKSHMNPEEALDAALDLGAKKSIGMHWGTFILTTEPIREPEIILNDLIIQNNFDDDFFVTIKPGTILKFNKN